MIKTIKKFFLKEKRTEKEEALELLRDPEDPEAKAVEAYKKFLNMPLDEFAKLCAKNLPQHRRVGDIEIKMLKAADAFSGEDGDYIKKLKEILSMEKL